MLQEFENLIASCPEIPPEASAAAATESAPSDPIIYPDALGDATAAGSPPTEGIHEPGVDSSAGFTWQGVALHPFTSSRQALFAQHRLSMGAPPLDRCLADLDAFQADAWRILWIGTHTSDDWGVARTRPVLLQQLIDQWTNEHPPGLDVEAVRVAYLIYADTRPSPSGN